VSALMGFCAISAQGQTIQIREVGSDVVVIGAGQINVTEWMSVGSVASFTITRAINPSALGLFDGVASPSGDDVSAPHTAYAFSASSNAFGSGGQFAPTSASGIGFEINNGLLIIADAQVVDDIFDLSGLFQRYENQSFTTLGIAETNLSINSTLPGSGATISIEAAIPEPSSLALMLLSGLGLFRRVRK